MAGVVERGSHATSWLPPCTHSCLSAPVPSLFVLLFLYASAATIQIYKVHACNIPLSKAPWGPNLDICWFSFLFHLEQAEFSWVSHLSSGPSQPLQKKDYSPEYLGVQSQGSRSSHFHWPLVAHACNPSYSGGKDQEDLICKPAWANSSWDPISKNTITKKDDPEFKPQYHKKKPLIFRRVN
jgi:hypothetical protein